MRPDRDQSWKDRALALARTKRFKGKPLSLAVHLNKPWRQVVQVLNDAHLANRDEFVMNGSVGLEEYGD